MTNQDKKRILKYKIIQNRYRRLKYNRVGHTFRQDLKINKWD